MGEVRFAERTARVTSATLDLYHLYSQRPGWDLEVELDGAIGELVLTGTGARPALPGPSPLDVAYIDRPVGRKVVRSALHLVELGQGKVAIRGTLETDAYIIEVDLEAALVT